MRPALLVVVVTVAAALAALARPRVALAQPSAPEAGARAPAASEDEALYSCKDRTTPTAVTLKPETELKDLLTWVMGFTCKSFMMDPRIVASSRKVTVIAPTKLTPAEAYRVFLAALSTIGLTVVPKGKALRIVESATAKKEVLPLYKQGMPDDADQMVRYVVQPTYAQADALAPAVTALRSDAGEVQVLGSLLLITDYASHVREMMTMIALLDVPTGSDAIYTIPILHADAGKLAEKLDVLLGLSAARPAATPATSAGAAVAPSPQLPSRLMADERTNTLMVIGSEASYRRIKALVDRLDIALEIEGGASIHVYRLGSAIAEELAQTLTRTIDSQGQQAKQAKTAAAPPALDNLGTALEGQVKIISDKPTNSLIVMSSGRDFLAIKDVIRELDQPRRQVFIEALILEVQIGRGLELGASAHGGLPSDGGSAILLGGVQTPSLRSTDVSTLAGASGLIGGLIGGPLANSTTILGKSIPSYGILFQALADQTSTNILSAPSIIAVDNEEAKYKVGTNIPYKKGVLPTTSGNLATSLTTNIDRQDLLLELDIKPHISIDDSVLLEIKQESKDLEDGTSELGPSWSTRSFETRVVARDQETVAIGGLMQERESTTVSKVPLLGDIPVVGHLFSYTSKSKKKTNLLILLTPYIIKDQLDLQTLRERKLREHDEFVRSFRSLEQMKFEPHIDYHRKRGLLEEINRTLEEVDADAAARAALIQPPRVAPGPVELPR